MHDISRWWKTVAAMLTVGAILPSCGTDMRDAAWSGVLDGVTGTISESIFAGLPLPEWIAGIWGG
ncbi:MAG: hypothetical protein JXA69_14900 [Phycisphaerae bacterium]|nr:hypothetical protein [Phycisphaerae bacterium]